MLLRSITINFMSTKDIHNVHKVRLSSWPLRISSDSGEPLGGAVQSRLKSWSYTGERRLPKSRPTVSEPSYSINLWPGQTNQSQYCVSAVRVAISTLSRTCNPHHCNSVYDDERVPRSSRKSPLCRPSADLVSGANPDVRQTPQRAKGCTIPVPVDRIYGD